MTTTYSQALERFNVDEECRLKSHNHRVASIQEHVDFFKGIDTVALSVSERDDMNVYEERIKSITKQFNTNKKARHYRFKKKWSNSNSNFILDFIEEFNAGKNK